MQNKTSIQSNGQSLYINSKIVANKMGLATLGVFNILTIIFIIWVFCQPEENTEFIKLKVGVLLLVMPTYIFTLGKYTAWNFWGEERIIINTKCINYQYSYGIIVLNDVTIPFHNLSMDIIITDNTVNNERGEFILFDYDQFDLPFKIFTSTVALSKKDLETINTKIKSLFINEAMPENQFFPFSLN